MAALEGVLLAAGAVYLLTRDVEAKPKASGMASDAAKADLPDGLAASRGPISGGVNPAASLAIVPGAFTPSADGTANRTASMDEFYAERVPVTPQAWNDYLVTPEREPSLLDRVMPFTRFIERRAIDFFTLGFGNEMVQKAQQQEIAKERAR